MRSVRRIRHEQHNERIGFDPARSNCERDVGKLFTPDPRAQAPVSEHSRTDNHHLRVYIRHWGNRKHCRLRRDRP